MRGASGDDAHPGDDGDPADGSDSADDTRPADGPGPADDAHSAEAVDQDNESAEAVDQDNESAGDVDEATESTGDGGPIDGVAAGRSSGSHQDGAAAPIDPDDLTVAERSLHPRIRILWVVRATLWALVLGGIATVVTWASSDVTLLAPVALTAVLLVLFVTHAVLRYRVWRYEFREDAIYLERGVLRRVRTVVPFVRIQHVDTARGPIERVAGLSTLVVYTAGSRGADVTIPGIEADRASDHQRRLKQLAIAAEDDTAV